MRKVRNKKYGNIKPFRNAPVRGTPIGGRADGQERELPAAARAIIVVFAVLAEIICGWLIYTFVFTMRLGQINAGNVTGVIYCAAVMILIAFYPAMRRKKPLRIAGKVTGVCMALFAVYCGAVSWFIASEMLHGADEAVAVSAADGGTPQTVIVLGCRTIDGEPSQMLTLRLGKALEYMNTHPDTVCVVTGGQGSDEVEPEAITMQRYLVGHGIAESRIYTESDSVNTEQNIGNAAKIIAAEGLPKNVVIVSECYHIYRGVRHAESAGLKASGIYPDPSSVIMTMPSYWVREIIAVSRDYIFDIIGI